MNLVLQLMMGVAVAGVAEGMALADRAGLQQRDVLEIFELTSLASPLLMEKGKGTESSQLKLLSRHTNVVFTLYSNSRRSLPYKLAVAAHAKRSKVVPCHGRSARTAFACLGCC